jgi:flagellar biosynthesis GTPase FlhF
VTEDDQAKASAELPQAHLAVPFLDIDKIIGDRQTKIIICCGSGGVGKTTTSAAIALRAAGRVARSSS